MNATFLILACLILASAGAAMLLRNLVHCALCLAVTFAALAGIYLQLSAQFVGFVQILVYVGAVAILIVFAILLTRGAEPLSQRVLAGGAWAGFAIAAAVFALLAVVILGSSALDRQPSDVAAITVRQLGDQLMTRYVLPLEVLGLLLTATLIGGVVIALREEPASGPNHPGPMPNPHEPNHQPLSAPGDSQPVSTP
jgi:NADH-quinone oxidoreductase subunit J